MSSDDDQQIERLSGLISPNMVEAIKRRASCRKLQIEENCKMQRANSKRAVMPVIRSSTVERAHSLVSPDVLAQMKERESWKKSQRDLLRTTSVKDESENHSEDESESTTEDSSSESESSDSSDDDQITVTYNPEESINLTDVFPTSFEASMALADVFQSEDSPNNAPTRNNNRSRSSEPKRPQRRKSGTRPGLEPRRKNSTRQLRRPMRKSKSFVEDNNPRRMRRTKSNNQLRRTKSADNPVPKLRGGRTLPNRTRSRTNRSSLHAKGASVLQTQLAQAFERQDIIGEEELEPSEHSGTEHVEEDNHDDEGSSEDEKISEMKRNKKKKKGVVKKAKGAFKKNKKSKRNHALLDDEGFFDNDSDGSNMPNHLNLLIEIVSARNILIGDTTTSDPYVQVKLGDKQIHKTSKIMKTLNPDWSPEKRSTFFLACQTRELFDFGLTFKVKDWDLIGGDDPLGHVFLDGQDLYEEEGDLREFEITPPKGQQGVFAGTLNIRCRRATRSDYLSLKNKEKKNLFATQY